MILSHNARPEARFLRQHTGAAPEPSAALRPLWHDLALGAALALFLFAFVFI